MTHVATGSPDRRRRGALLAGRAERREVLHGTGGRPEGALEKLTRTLDAQNIPYAIIGALALNELGYQRVTVDVNVILTAEGLAAFKATSLGRGYVEKFPGSRGLRDPEYGVDIDVVLAGGYPGDGQPKPVAFPDPPPPPRREARASRCCRSTRSSS